MQEKTQDAPLIIICSPILLLCLNYALSCQNLEQVFKSKQLAQVFFLITYSMHLMQINFVTTTL